MSRYCLVEYFIDITFYKFIADYFHLQGSHITLYARNEDDVSPDEIMRQVKKTTSNFTFVAPKEGQTSEPQAVVSVATLFFWLLSMLAYKAKALHL